MGETLSENMRHDSARGINHGERHVVSNPERPQEYGEHDGAGGPVATGLPRPSTPL